MKITPVLALSFCLLMASTAMADRTAYMQFFNSSDQTATFAFPPAYLKQLTKTLPPHSHSDTIDYQAVSVAIGIQVIDTTTQKRLCNIQINTNLPGSDSIELKQNGTCCLNCI
tara:strand:- start:32888 stop:33226 length:339 start_codon:yes stop_codon:yes gene_type:complete